MNRKNYVDYIKAIGIILVILGHINFANDTIKEWIYAFHMPLFFFASGLVLRKQTINLDFILKKFKGLMIPYFIWGFIYSGLSTGNIVRIGYGSYYMISSADSLTSLWFLPVMFVAVILTQIVLKICKNSFAICSVMTGLLIVSIFIPQFDIGYPWCIDVSLLATVFILFGYLFENGIGKILKWKEYLWIVLGIIGFTLTLTYGFNPIAIDSYVLMAERRIGNLILFVIAALGGCLMVYGIARVFENIPWNKEMLIFIGKNTLVIFIVQKPLILIFEKCFSFFNLSWGIELIFTGIGVLLGSCSMCLLIDQFAPCLSGKILISKSK